MEFQTRTQVHTQKASFPPLGLLTVAAMLPAEWSKRLVDVNATKLTDKDLKWADYAFFSSMVVQRKSAHQLIGQCKEAGVKIVAGGPLFTSEHEQFKDVDHFVLNEAEITLPPFSGRPEKRLCQANIHDA